MNGSVLTANVSTQPAPARALAARRRALAIWALLPRRDPGAGGAQVRHLSSHPAVVVPDAARADQVAPDRELLLRRLHADAGGRSGARGRVPAVRARGSAARLAAGESPDSGATADPAQRAAAPLPLQRAAFHLHPHAPQRRRRRRDAGPAGRSAAPEPGAEERP